MSDLPKCPVCGAEMVDYQDSSIPRLFCGNHGFEMEDADYRTLCARFKAGDEDTKRIDFLESQKSYGDWIARKSTTGRGYRLHTTHWPGSSPTVREAIDRAMADTPPTGEKGTTVHIAYTKPENKHE